MKTCVFYKEKALQVKRKNYLFCRAFL